LTLAHLYPELLNIYGDKGNIIAIKKRCEWRDIELEIIEIHPADRINSDVFDMYFIGGGQDQQQIAVADELQSVKEELREAAENYAVFLSICGGYQLLGHYYQPHAGNRIEGISILDAYTVAGNTRYIGNVTVETSIMDSKNTILTGFENHSGLTYLQGNTKPIGIVKVGNGNNGKDKGEGGFYKNVFGTYLHGSLLPKNPHFTDYLIKLALNKRYNDNIELKPIDAKIELEAHKKAVMRKY
jgi:CobQ-like glutamine amidotransferase family enzyme